MPGAWRRLTALRSPAPRSPREWRGEESLEPNGGQQPPPPDGQTLCSTPAPPQPTAKAPGGSGYMRRPGSRGRPGRSSPVASARTRSRRGWRPSRPRRWRATVPATRTNAIDIPAIVEKRSTRRIVPTQYARPRPPPVACGQEAGAARARRSPLLPRYLPPPSELRCVRWYGVTPSSPRARRARRTRLCSTSTRPIRPPNHMAAKTTWTTSAGVESHRSGETRAWPKATKAPADSSMP